MIVLASLCASGAGSSTDTAHTRSPDSLSVACILSVACTALPGVDLSQSRTGSTSEITYAPCGNTSHLDLEPTVGRHRHTFRLAR